MARVGSVFPDLHGCMGLLRYLDTTQVLVRKKRGLDAGEITLDKTFKECLA